MTLEKLIANATCKLCNENVPKHTHSDGHIVWCGGGCTPEKFPKGHYRECTSQAGNEELIKAIKTYIKKRIKKASKRTPKHMKSINYDGRLTILGMKGLKP